MSEIALIGFSPNKAARWLTTVSSDTTGYFEGLLRAFPGLLFNGRPSPSVNVVRKSVLLKQTMFYRILIEWFFRANMS